MKIAGRMKAGALAGKAVQGHGFGHCEILPAKEVTTVQALTEYL